MKGKGTLSTNQGHKTDPRLQEIQCPWNSREQMSHTEAVCLPPCISHKTVSESKPCLSLPKHCENCSPAPPIPSPRIWECQPLKSTKVCSWHSEVDLSLFFHFSPLTSFLQRGQDSGHWVRSSPELCADTAQVCKQLVPVSFHPTHMPAENSL